MKFAARALAVLTLCSLGAASLPAQGIGLGVGTMIPQGDLADGAKTGFAGIASIELGLGTRLALRGEALWANSDLDGQIVTDGSGVPLPSGTNVSGDVKFVGGLASLVLRFGDGPVRPYALGGAGYYRRSVSQKASGAVGDLGDLSVKESDLGYHFGAGLELTILGISAFGEARYHSVETDDARVNFVPLLVGIRL